VRVRIELNIYFPLPRCSLRRSGSLATAERIRVSVVELLRLPRPCRRPLLALPVVRFSFPQYIKTVATSNRSTSHGQTRRAQANWWSTDPHWRLSSVGGNLLSGFAHGLPRMRPTKHPAPSFQWRLRCSVFFEIFTEIRSTKPFGLGGTYTPAPNILAFHVFGLGVLLTRLHLGSG
jgi:hypothetical protein